MRFFERDYGGKTEPIGIGPPACTAVVFSYRFHEGAGGLVADEHHHLADDGRRSAHAVCVVERTEGKSSPVRHASRVSSIPRKAINDPQDADASMGAGV